jgi:hypothetical protein
MYTENIEQKTVMRINKKHIAIFISTIRKQNKKYVLMNWIGYVIKKTF